MPLGLVEPVERVGVTFGQTAVNAGDGLLASAPMPACRCWRR